MGSHSVTCHPKQVNTPRHHPGQYSIYLPRRDGRLSWPRWLVTYRPQTVTHPSTNRARCRLTLLIKPTPLTTTPCHHLICVKKYKTGTWSLTFTRAHWRRQLWGTEARAPHPHSTSHCSIFQVTSEPHKLGHLTTRGCYRVKNTWGT